MEKISDIVEAVKFFPSKPGRVVVRLLRHPEPVLSLYTQSDPLGYGDVDYKVENVSVPSHYDLMRLLACVPAGKALCIEAYPRSDLQGWVTRAYFTYCDINDGDAPPVSGAVEMMGPNGSEWNLPSPSGSRLVRKSARPRPPTPPPDPESIFDPNPVKPEG